MVNVAETFTDILKHYFLQTNFVKFEKCMLNSFCVKNHLKSRLSQVKSRLAKNCRTIHCSEIFHSLIFCVVFGRGM